MNWKAAKEAGIEFLKSRIVTTALLKILGKTAGFRAWIITFILEKAFKMIAEPTINTAIRKGLLVYDKTRGKILLKRVMEAKEEGNEEGYRKHIGRL